MKRLMKIASNEYTLISEASFTYSNSNCSRPRKDNSISGKKIQALNNEITSDLNEMGNKGLAEYLDGSYYNIEKGIIENIFVKYSNNKVITTVKATRELTDEELDTVKNYIIGQYSDGWGEGFEQYPYYTYGEGYTKTEYYCHLWSPSTNYYWN